MITKRQRIQFKVYMTIDRCHNPANEHWHDYGGRGISVHLPWKICPHLFTEYLMTLPGWDNKNLVLDRENNDGNYEPGNLRFVSQSVSQKNRRRWAKEKIKKQKFPSWDQIEAIYFLFHEHKKKMRSIAKLFRVSESTICNILNAKRSYRFLKFLHS